MTTDRDIQKWLKDGVISEEQARKMQVDAAQTRTEDTSNRLVVVISTIGSVLLGLGAILFIAANWQVIPAGLKVLILLAATFGAYYIGYIFRYEKQNYPRIGDSLIFLGSLLFGASIFLIAQIYNINADSHFLVLLWLLGILPLVYAFASLPIAALSAVLFLVWVALAIFHSTHFTRSQGDILSLPVLYLVLGILLFGIGAWHYGRESLRGVARIYRLGGIKVAMISLFLLTFRLFSGHYERYDYFVHERATHSPDFVIGLILAAVLAVAATLFNLFRNPAKSETNDIENGVAFGLLGVVLVFFFIPPMTNFFVLIFNLVMAGLIFLLLWIGYRREDMNVINIGMGWLVFFLLVKYFDFFWSLLPRSLFFMVGGIILIGGCILFENKRRELKARFAKGGGA